MIEEYIQAEVVRQGFKRGTADFRTRVTWMAEAWAMAQARARRPIVTSDVLELGFLVERDKNKNGYRNTPVYVGSEQMMHHSLVGRQIEVLLQNQQSIEADQLYYQFELVHPFIDGNGRVGKILFNWRLGTLNRPLMPSNWWGIKNP